MTPDAMVEEARILVGENGFKTLKLKGAVLEPELEIETMRKLREAFPESPLRIDPMGGWTVETAIRASRALEGTLEYLEDPVLGMDNMAAVAAEAPMPLATNLCVIEFEHLPEAIKKDAVQVVLSDHHYWGGLRASKHLARICQAAGMGVSMHSNSHLGISLAAMTHLAASTPNLEFDCDTHYPWTDIDVIKGGKRVFEDGALTVSTKRIPKRQGSAWPEWRGISRSGSNPPVSSSVKPQMPRNLPRRADASTNGHRQRPRALRR